MAKPTATPVTSDIFDANEYLKQDVHAKDMNALETRIQSLEDKLGSNEKIADTLCEASEKAVKMREMLEKNFIDLVSKNDSVRTEIKNIIKSADRDFVQSKLKQYGTWIGAVFLFLSAQISIELIKWLIHFLTKTPPT